MRSRPEAETSVAAIMKIQEKPWRVRRPVSSSGDGEKQLDSRLTWEVELMRFPEEYLQDSILNGFFNFLLKSLFTNYLFTYQINFIKVWFPCDTMYTFKCTLLTSAHLCNHWHDQDLEHFHQVKIPLRSASLLPPAPGNHKSAFCHDRLVLLDFHAIGIMRFVLFRLWPHSLRIFWYPSMLCAWAVCNILLITGIHWVVDHSLFTRDGRFLRCSHSFFFCLFFNLPENPGKQVLFFYFPDEEIEYQKELVQGSPPELETSLSLTPRFFLSFCLPRNCGHTWMNLGNGTYHFSIYPCPHFFLFCTRLSFLRSLHLPHNPICPFPQLESSLSSNPGSAPSSLCDFGQVTSPLWTSIPLWNWDHICILLYWIVPSALPLLCLSQFLFGPFLADIPWLVVFLWLVIEGRRPWCPSYFWLFLPAVQRVQTSLTN